MAYNSGEKRVGEKYRYHIKGENIHDYSAASDRDVDEGRTFFTKGFGVRITNWEDVEALDTSVEAYMKRPEKTDIPIPAVERAVKLKKTYFPESKWLWDENDFNKIPYVAAIPSVQFGAPPLEFTILPETTIQQSIQNNTIPASNVVSPGVTTPKSFTQRAWTWSKQNWWIIITPVALIPVVIIAKKIFAKKKD